MRIANYLRVVFGWCCFVDAAVVIVVIDSSKHWTREKKQISRLVFHLIFHHFSLCNCCLNVVLYLNKGDCPENSYVVFCPNK